MSIWRSRMRVGPEHGLERLLAFTDAVVAIAVTLLILPLADQLTEVLRTHAEHHTAAPPLTDQLFGDDELRSMLIAFAVSFTVIARNWWSHHQVFEHVRGYTAALVWLDLAWTMTVVFLPLPTAYITVDDFQGGTFGVYVGTMTAESLLLTVMALIIHRTSGIAADRGHDTRHRLIGSVVSTSGFAAALIVGLLVPGVHYYSLLLLFAAGRTEWLVQRRFDRREAVA